MSLMIVFGITLAAFLLVIAGMAVGVMMGRREISGSCGGLGNMNSAETGEAPSCSLCSNPAAACQELKERMQGGGNQVARQESDCDKDCVAEGCSNEEIAACKGS